MGAEIYFSVPIYVSMEKLNLFKIYASFTTVYTVCSTSSSTTTFEIT